jgi:hypothetical protein
MRLLREFGIPLAETIPAKDAEAVGGIRVGCGA